MDKWPALITALNCRGALQGGGGKAIHGGVIDASCLQSYRKSGSREIDSASVVELSGLFLQIIRHRWTSVSEDLNVLSVVLK